MQNNPNKVSYIKNVIDIRPLEPAWAFQNNHKWLELWNQRLHSYQGLAKSGKTTRINQFPVGESILISRLYCTILITIANQ